MGARSVLALAGLLAIAGCGGPSVTRAPLAPPCATRTPASHPADTLTVVLFDAVDLSHAPWGRNREERFVFSHLYETLLTVDCHGEFQAGLAKRCVEASDGWLIEMREDARFWDQTPVTAYEAADVIKRAIAQGIAIASVDVVDEHSMILHGYSDRPDLKLLTLQMLAVTKPAADGIAPIGSGPWMLDEGVPVAEAVVIRPSSEAEYPIVRFVQGNAGDARDILDGTADAMITDDPSTIEYAREKKTIALTPLAWDRAYVLLSRTRSRLIEDGHGVDDLPISVCNALARDAVNIDARGGSSIAVDAEKASRQRIESDFSSMPIFSSDLPILVAANDPVSRSLAERIVALASMDTSSFADARAILRAVPGAGRGMRVVAMAPPEFERARRAGDGFAFVAALSWCSDFPDFIGKDNWAPWLFNNYSIRGKLVPLVETRAHFIAISDRIGFIDDHNGGVHILGPSVVKVR